MLRMVYGTKVRGGALLDGKLEEYEAAWQAAGGEDISTAALGELFKKLGQPLDAYRCQAFVSTPECPHLDACSATSSLGVHVCISTAAVRDLIKKLSQPLDAYRWRPHCC